MTVPNVTPELLALLTPDERAELDELLGDPVPDGLVDRSHPRQAAFIEDQSRFICLLGTRRCLAEGTMVATPTGAVPIERLRAGDLVYDETASVTVVKRVFDQGVRPVVTFSNNGQDYVTATADHPFRVHHVTGRFRPKEMPLGSIYHGVRIDRRETHVPMGLANEPHAYVIGAFLGDGCKHHSPRSIMVSGNDESVIAKCAALMGASYKKVNGNNRSWSIRGVFNHYAEWMHGKYAHNKMIDVNVIKRWNRRSCLDFFAGLIDTDGSLSIGADGPTLCISMQNKAVIDVARWLALSLWNVQMSVGEDRRKKYRNGSVWELKTKHTYHVGRMLSELSPFIQCDRKKRVPVGVGNNFNPSGLGGSVRDAGTAHCYDIEVSNESHLFLLANGLVTHNCGKSTGCVLRILYDAYQHPGANYMFLGITLDSAKKAVWKDGFKEIDARLGLGLKFNEVASTVTLPNGAIVYVMGMDSSDQQQRKVRGGKYRGVVIDEVQDFALKLEDLVAGAIKPALADQQGWLVLAGTPGQVPTGLFYRLSAYQRAEKPGCWVVRDADTATEWRGHTWSAYDNPGVAEQIRSDIEEQERINPDVRNTPKFQREWRGMWVTDDDRRVYRYVVGRNDYEKLPKYATGHWNYVLGIDLGFNDDTAIVCVGWHDHDRTAYIIDCDKKPGLDITDAANWIRSWMRLYDSPYVVVDGANKQAVEEMRRRHGLPLIAADKRGKEDFTDLMNAEFANGTIKLSPECDALRDEYAHLSWDERAWKRGKRIEDPKAASHLCDAAAYAWRFSATYLSDDEPVEIARGTAEWHAQQEAELIARTERRVIATMDAEADLWRYA